MDCSDKRQLSLNAKRQDALKFSDETSNKFFDHITEAFTSAAIPFHKLQCRKVKSLLETWSGQAAPDESTLRKNYLPKQFNKVISAIKEAVTGKNYYIMVDEATDPAGRFLVGVLIGVLDNELKPPMLFNLAETEKTDAVAINQIVNSSLCSIFDEMDYSKFRLFVSDGASYMLKAGKLLKGLFPKLLHITCLAHGLNRLDRVALTACACYHQMVFVANCSVLLRQVFCRISTISDSLGK